MKIFQKDVHVISQKSDDQKSKQTKEKSWSIRNDSEKTLKFNYIEIYLKDQGMSMFMQLEKQKKNHERTF